MRTALMVGRLGTVSATASAMGVHRSTVSRHIDVLEEALGTRLFLRHKEGYTLTEDGRHMLDVANKADSLFTEFANQVVSRPGDLKGVLTISAMSGAAPILPPVMLTFHRKHPRVTFRFVTETRLAKLEKNEAHVAIRTSPKPKEPDYVVTPLRSFRVGLYAHRDYLKEVGYPRVPQDLAKHRFVGPPNIALHSVAGTYRRPSLACRISGGRNTGPTRGPTQRSVGPRLGLRGGRGCGAVPAVGRSPTAAGTSHGPCMDRHARRRPPHTARARVRLGAENGNLSFRPPPPYPLILP